MYGFHKKVGLSDNSMRASERKNKSPSEYTNPYFRRGHQDLLWLIQKPKNVTGTGNKRKGKADNEANEDDLDDYVDDVVVNSSEARVRNRPGQLTLGQTETALTQEQFQSVQRELAAIRHQQSQISRMMQALKREHEQLYGQAATFQDQHNRHENSINAILTFLATVYNRSLQGHDGMQGIANMFGNAMPVDTSQGNVVDVGDFTFDNLVSPDGSLAKPFKKQPLLLTDGQQGRASTLSPRDNTNSPYPQRARLPNQNTRNTQQSSLTPNVEEVFDPGVNSPNTGAQQNVQQFNTNIPQRDMMSVIQNANARNNSASPSTPQQDFNSVLNSLEASGGTGPLNNSQRADVLRMINNSTRQPSGSDNALINSTPPPGPANFHRRLASTNADFDHLAKLQAEQDKSVQNLTNLLQPLSPTGSIPGIGDGQSLPPPPLDIDDFLNHNEYFADFPTDANGNYDFGNTGLGNTTANHGTGGPSDLDFVDYKDDDELFGNLSQPGKQHGVGMNTYDYNAMDGSTTAEPKYDNTSDFEGGGRVESVPSSEVTTPNSTDIPPATAVRPKGRKLSSIDDNTAAKKRRRS
jgi:heat shock transcription factor